MYMENLQHVGISQFATATKTIGTEKEKNLFNEPNNLTGRQLVGKTFLGIGIGWIISALLFVVLTFIGGMFMNNVWGGNAATGIASAPNPLLPMILLFIGFLSTFIGNISVAWLYALFYSKKYINTSKNFWLLLLTNGLLFFILAPIYLIFSKDTTTLFLILGFHVLFSVFVSACQTEFTTNPNYAWSALMGNIIGFAGALLGYSIIFQITSNGTAQQQTYLLMLLPSILWYGLIPLWSWIREKVYYKLYEMGNNAFFIASPGENTQTSTDIDKSNNDMQEINIES